MKHMLMLWLVMAACTDPSMVEDGVGDSFVSSGKADTSGVVEGSPEAIGVLALANEASLAVLDGDVGLTAGAASNIVAYRLGDDETAGTGDDQRFDTLAELDAVPFVGPVAWQRLLAYAQANGYVASPPPPADAPALPAGIGSGEGAATCTDSASSWSQTCYPWQPCDYPVTSGRTKNGTTTVTVQCSLAGDTLTCAITSTTCDPGNWWIEHKTITGNVAANGTFLIEADRRWGDAANYTWSHDRVPGRVIRNGTATTLILDELRVESGNYSSGKPEGGSTTYKSTYYYRTLSPTITFVLSP